MQDSGGSPVEHAPAAMSRSEYARAAADPDFVRHLTADPPEGGPNPNLLGFTNHGGLLGKGVCWWHSRLTRNALYLAYFLPEEPPPPPAGVSRILGDLMNARAVTAVPGHSCLRRFSLEHRDEIESLLQRRQILEGFLHFAWINGLVGLCRMEPCRMRSAMEHLHEAAMRGLVYVKFQNPGLDAHSIIVTSSEKLRGGGYLSRYLDSNSRKEESFAYHFGYRYVTLASGMTGVPYVQRSGELTRILGLLRDFVSRERFQGA